MIKQLIRLAAVRRGLASIGRALMTHGAEATNSVAFAAVLTKPGIR